MKITGRLFLALCLLGLVSCAGEPSTQPSAAPAATTAAPAATTAALPSGTLSLETEEQKLLYMLGLAAGERLVQVGLSEDELSYVFAGVRDRALQRQSAIDELQYGPRLGAYAQQRFQQTAAQEPELSAQFVAEQAAQPGAVVTDSGMVYLELTSGSGESPGPDSTVVVHYLGRLRSGAVFDSSYVRGEPSTVSLARRGDQQVIPCWREGVQRMKVGGKSRLVCPSETAYGSQGAPPRILPGAALFFEVELLEVKPAEPSASAPPTE